MMSVIQDIHLFLKHTDFSIHFSSVVLNLLLSYCGLYGFYPVFYHFRYMLSACSTSNKNINDYYINRQGDFLSMCLKTSNLARHDGTCL